MAKDNDILYRINGIPIRKLNKVFFQYNEGEYVKMVTAASNRGISVAELLRIMSSPCDQCGNDKITIPLTLMSKKHQKSGRKIGTYHKKPEDE